MDESWEPTLSLNPHEMSTPYGALSFLVARPAESEVEKLLVLIHGKGRTYERMMKSFSRLTLAQGYTLLVPIFDQGSFSDFHLLHSATGPRGAASALLSACDYVTHRYNFTCQTFSLVGFSAGAQFAHRFAMAYPERVSKLVPASAGWYTMPDPLIAYPYGCAASICDPKGLINLSAFLSLPIRVMAGELDVARDQQLRQTPILDAQQGTTRVERAQRWVKAVNKAAIQRGIMPQATFELLPNTGHSLGEAIRKGMFVQRVLSFIDMPN